eukprot:UN32302
MAAFPRIMCKKHPTRTAELYFLVGRKELAEAELHAISLEPDVILPNLHDLDYPEEISFNSATTSKVLWGIHWAVRYFNFTYLARMGDDTYFNIVQFFNIMNTLPDKAAVIARHRYDALIREEKIQYFLRMKRWVRFPTGQGYLITEDICEYIKTASSIAPFLVTTPEDAIMGMWLAP